MARLFAELLATARMLTRPIVGWIGRWTRWLVRAIGGLALVLIVGACTRVLYDLHRWLGRGAGECTGAPDAIVVLGGSGMPSGPELLRLHRAAALAHEAPKALVFVVQPDTGATMRQMVDELVLRGVADHRIIPIPFGENTREQALVIARIQASGWRRIALVTAPENMYRSVRAFQKAGVKGVCGEAAWEQAMDHDFAYRHKAIGGKAWAPDVSDNT
ncbi:MAG TPA: YdcF family protein, partial [Flavobacteriales bacterium]|nr:YdcF family protein [Flavobacteriales bacterium]